MKLLPAIYGQVSTAYPLSSLNQEMYNTNRNKQQKWNKTHIRQKSLTIEQKT